MDGLLNTNLLQEKPKKMTPEVLAEMVSQLKEHPRPKWILISPDGVLYEGTADQLTPVIAKHLSFL